MLEAFLHVALIFRVIEIKAKFAEQFLWLVAENVGNPLVDKGELAIECMSRDEFIVRIGAHQVIRVGH